MFRVSIPDEHRIGFCNIPKLIAISIPYRSDVDSFGLHMPDWSLVTLDIADGLRFVRDHYPEYLHLYTRLRMTKDKIRLMEWLWLHLHGGICVQRGYSLNEPLDALFFQDSDLYFVSTDCMGYKISDILIGSKQGVSFWIDLINGIQGNTIEDEYLEKFLSTSKYQYMSLPVKVVVPTESCNNLGSSSMLGMLTPTFTGYANEINALQTKIESVEMWSKRNPTTTIYIFGGIILFLLLLLMLVTISRR